jgi:hypothetical protein
MGLYDYYDHLTLAHIAEAFFELAALIFRHSQHPNFTN